LRELDAFGHPNWLLSEERPAALRRREDLVARRVDHARRKGAPGERVWVSFDDGDADGVVGNPIEVVDCAVDWVDYPVQPARAARGVALFAEEAVVGARIGQ
jgi:hypothetical protein